MSTYKSPRHRFWATLFVLFYLIATLLPARVAAAAALAGSCASANQQASAATVNRVVPVSADQVVVIPNQTITAAIFQANWLANYQQVERVRALLQGQFLVSTDYRSESQNAAYVRWLKRVDEKIVYDNLHDSAHYLDETVHTMLDEALKEPALAMLVPQIWNDLNTYNPEDPAFRTGILDRLVQSTERYDLGERMLALAPEWIVQVHDCAQKDAEFAKFFDVYNLDKLGVSIRADAKTILAQKPDLPIPAPIRQQIAAGGTVAISLNELKALGQSEMEKLNATIDDMQKTIKDIDERQKVIVDYLSNQAEKARLQELARKKDAEYKLQLEAAQAGISIITTIANEIDPKFAKKFHVVASSALQIGKAVKDWLSATAGMDGLDKVFSLSTVVMTGNIVGAVSNIFGLFGPEEPTPEEVILAEIGKLRQQVDQLRTEMHDRFDRIDEGLNAIYTTMHERFHQIDLQLGKINGNIIEVQQALAGLDVKLSRIERNNFDLINAVSRRPLLEAVNGGLGYRQRTGQPMTQVQFAQFENQFHSWATLHAFDPGNVGPTQRDYGDAALLNELTTYPIDANLNYINGWLVTHGFPAISSKPLPSPRAIGCWQAAPTRSWAWKSRNRWRPI
ncbi:MAG: hypothetical protein DYG89_47435 [Caldilinea sp. CFX5]|nr:hypothetical protein [Caldilinea sp. CFX5]